MYMSETVEVSSANKVIAGAYKHSDRIAPATIVDLPPQSNTHVQDKVERQTRKSFRRSTCDAIMIRRAFYRNI